MKHFLQLLLLISLQLSITAQVTYNVDAGNVFFNPSVLVINQGDIVQWTNTGGFHNVNGTIADNPGNAEDFFSGAPSGAAWSFSKTFNLTGINNYYCDVHGGGMSGTITVNGPLPIELKYITTSVSLGTCKIEWKTDKEENLEKFVLQRSANAVDFKDVISVAANHQPSTYSYIDDLGADRFVYYRVKIIDADNTSKYTPIRLAQNDLKISKNTLHLLPNPYTDHFHINVQSIRDWSGKIHIYDFTGRILYQEVYSFKEGNNYIHVDGSEQFPKGLYLVTIHNTNNKEFLSESVIKE